MKRFSFLAHPLTVKGILERIEPFSDWNEEEIRWFSEKKPLQDFLKKTLHEKTEVEEVDTIQGIRSVHTGEEICGDIISCMLLPEQMLSLPKAFVRERILKCIEISKEYGASVVSLGGYTSILMATWRDIPVHGSKPIFTIGNTYTISVAISATLRGAELIGLPLENAVGVVVGATGSIGWVCAQLLARKGLKRLSIVARNEKQLQQKVAYLNQITSIPVTYSTNPEEVIKEADIIIAATSTPYSIIDASALKTGTLVCDVSVPHNIDEVKARERKDILIIDGGLVQSPGEEIITKRKSPFPPKISPSCLAEGAILTLEGGNYTRYPFAPITIEEVSNMQALAQKHGFQPSQHLISFGKIIPDERIETVRKARISS